MLKKIDVLMGGHVELDEEMPYVFSGKEKDGNNVVLILNGKGITLESLVTDAMITLLNHYGKNTIGKVAVLAAFMTKVKTDALKGEDVKLGMEFMGTKFDTDEFLEFVENDEKKDR